ncbi:amidohydrolase family protein [Microbacterium sp. 22179]|uniref:amidohydrolase family protein n=1 Tax=Microbacterium sp. 22179 TaxID=3453886 RepID=UPI003F842414
MRVLDTHLHMWDEEVLTYTWLEGPYAYRFAETEVEHDRLDVEREEAVFVQAETTEGDYIGEVRWVQSLAGRLGIAGIVAGAQLHRGIDTVTHLEELATHPLVVGVRHNLQNDPDGLAVSSAFVTGAREVAARGWTFDVCVRAAQLPDIARLAGAVPELRMVLDHLGKPAVGTADAPLAPSAEWVRDIEEVAKHPETFCKLSGLPAESGGVWSAEQLVPFLDAAADAFGVERLMWGSDWPVSSIGPAEEGDPHAPADGSATYQPHARQRWLDTVVEWAETRGHDVDAILWANGRRFYRLDDPRVESADAPRRGFFGRLFGG